MMATVIEDVSCVYLRVIGKNMDIPNLYIEALIGTEGELASINNSIKIKDLGNLNNHLRELINKEVMPHDKIPNRTIGYVVTNKCYRGHRPVAYVFRDKVYNELSFYEYSMNPQEGDARWN